MIEAVNPYLLKLVGYTRRELMKKRPREVGAFGRLAWTTAAFKNLQAGNASRPRRLRLRTRDGRAIEAELVSRRRTVRGRDVIECSLTCAPQRPSQNITLFTSEAELRAWFACMREVVLVIDDRGEYRSIAPTDPSLLYLPPKQLLGKRLRDVFPPRQAAALAGTVRRVLATRRVAEVEYELPIGGRRRWFATSISRLDATKTLWVAHDITRRKEAEFALGQSEARYRALTEAALDAIISVGSQGRIVSWNKAARTMFGYSASEARGLPLTVLIPSIAPKLDSIDQDRNWADFVAHVTGKPAEVEGRRKNGSPFSLELSLSEWMMGDERYYTAILHDLVSRKQAENELRAAKEMLEQANFKLQQSLAREEALARADGLTGLCNRMHFDELAAREFAAAVRHGRDLAAMMIDVDHFKRVNDTLGHAAGDKVLVHIAQRAAAHVRAADVIARLGGDEFVLLLPESSAQEALALAERLRTDIASSPLPAGTKTQMVTLSIGIADLVRTPMDASVEEIVRRADKALYRAKADGRNRSMIFDPDMERDSEQDTGRIIDKP